MINLHRKTSNRCGLALGNDHRVFELGNKRLRLLCQDRVRNQQLVLKAFFDSDTGSDRVLERVETEAKRRIVIQDLVEELSALLDLEIVGSVHCSFVDSATKISFFGFTLSRTHIDVQSKHIVNGKLLGLHSLVESFLIEDHLVAIDQVLFQLVRKDTFKGAHLVRISDLLDHLSNLVVVVTWLDQAKGSLGGVVGSQNNIGFFASHWSILVRLDYQSMSNKSSEPVDMHSELDVEQVPFLDVD